MALLNHNSRDCGGPIRFFVATATIAAGPAIDPVAWKKDGASRNWFAGHAGIDPKSSIPSGARHPVAWLPPQEAGGLSSRNNSLIALSGAGFATLGLPASGSASVVFSGTATGGLIVSGSGTATLTISADATILSVASGSGSAAITLTGSANIGAEAGLSGSATIALSAAATSYAIGYLSGTSTNETGFSEAALARAVWTAAAIDYSDSATMGGKVNAAGAAADPWAVALPGSYAEGTAGSIIGSKLLTLARFLLFK